jgi:hypothetical protein
MKEDKARGIGQSELWNEDGGMESCLGEGSSMFLQNVGIQPKDHMAQQPTRPPSIHPVMFLYNIKIVEKLIEKTSPTFTIHN